MLMSAAGAGGDALYIENVFRTSLYKGTSAQHTITNGIDFSTEGGLVWTKNRDNSTQHGLCDTVSTGVGKDLSTSSTATLKGGVENLLKSHLPEIKEVVALNG